MGIIIMAYAATTLGWAAILAATTLTLELIEPHIANTTQWFFTQPNQR